MFALAAFALAHSLLGASCCELQEDPSPLDEASALVAGIGEEARAGAPELAAELGARALELLGELEVTERDARPVSDACVSLADAAKELGDDDLELRARQLAAQVLEPWLVPHAEVLQERRRTVAQLLLDRGRLAESRTWTERIVVSCGALPPSDPDRLLALNVLASVLQRLGEPERACETYEAVLRGLGPPAPDNALEVARAHQNLGAVLADDLRRFEPAIEHFEKALQVHSSRLDPEDRIVLQDRLDLASVMVDGRRPGEALPHLRFVLAAVSRQPRPDELQRSRVEADLAYALYELQELEEARDLLFQAIPVLERSLAAADPELRVNRRVLAHVLELLGDLAAAREVRGRVLADTPGGPEAAEDLAQARAELATVLAQMGDHPQALVLREQVLRHAESTRPESDPYVVEARRRYAESLADCGEFEAALEVYTQLVAPDAWHVRPGDAGSFQTRRGLGFVLRSLGRLEEAAELQRELLEVQEAWRGVDSLDTQWRRLELATTLRKLGRLPEALELEERALSRISTLLPRSHPYAMDASLRLARTLALAGRKEDLARLLHEAAEARTEWTTETALLSPREVRQLLAVHHDFVSLFLSLRDFVEAPEDLDGRCFEMAETARRLASVGGVRTSAASTEEARGRVLRLREQIHDLVSGSESTSPEVAAELSSLVAERDQLETEMRRRLAREGEDVHLRVGELARSLPGEVAAVGYLRYRRWGPGPESSEPPRVADAFLAHVLLPSGRLQRVDLGPASAVEAAVRAWRRALEPEVGDRLESPARLAELDEAGRRLRALVLDPVLAVAGGRSRLLVVPDDVLCLVPLDVLPLGEGLVGDAYRLELACCFGPSGSPSAVGDGPPGGLVLVGAVDFDAPERESTPLTEGFVFRAPGEAGYEPLPNTRREVDALRDLYRDVFGEDPRVLTGAEATKAALGRAAGEARFLHLATHGYFAGGAAGVGVSERSPTDPVHGLAPFTLCGVALAGANRIEKGGRVPGILTGEELAGYDLSRCELAVLSACETNAGLARAGQGLSSLQSALHAAGVRSTVTSLWRVDDASTCRFMEEFYRHVWKEGRTGADALWLTKKSMERARLDLFLWGGWVLTDAEVASDPAEATEASSKSR